MKLIFKDQERVADAARPVIYYSPTCALSDQGDTLIQVEAEVFNPPGIFLFTAILSAVLTICFKSIKI